MAVRITHTNNSDGHDGTFVYRSTSTMDPMALPDPIADEPPVALGAVFEYIDGDISEFLGQLCYRTQDHEDGQLSTVSDEVCASVTSVGDYVGGGVYAGIITYADGREFHLISGLAESETVLAVKEDSSDTPGDEDDDDGWDNTQAMIDDGAADHPAAAYCVDYTNDGYSFFYLPSKNELLHIMGGLFDHPEFSDNTSSGDFTWTSTEGNDTIWAVGVRFATGSFSGGLTKTAPLRVRPIRRVPV